MKLVKKTPKISEPMYKDLHDVMDYKKPLTIFFSGVEQETYLDILYDMGIRNFLMSYEYLKGKGSSVFKKYEGIRLFIDSGAFTYQSDPKYESYTTEQWVDQIHKYLSWVEKHKDYIFAIADLDLQYLPNVGYETVYEWRKQYFEPFMLRTGVPVCFIYHEDGLDYWEYMCKRYPYVGFSLSIDSGDMNTLREMFRIAEKHNSLCQGMASTNTKMLTELPFYTVDSTTWNVGLKYGEISVWTGTKMTRIKKADFQTKAFPLIAKYHEKFDFDLILAEDKTEMIRVNAYAFIEAEKFVNERLKSRMYWFKQRACKQDLDNLPSDFFPTQGELSSHSFDVSKYAAKMNINPEYEEAQNLVHDATVFCNWDNPNYSKSVSWYSAPEQEDIINDLHDTYVNRIVPDTETKIQDLIEFFRECVSGENDKLLQLGTNFDRTVKERDSYIEDDEETELVDLTPEEVQVRLLSVIPDKLDSDGMPEVTELDKEIFSKTDIVPTFDSRGKFVKGQVAVRKPKQVYSSKYPKLACDTCYAAQKCPEYKAGYVCAYQKMFKRFQTRNTTDIMQAMQGMADFNLERMQRAMVLETLTGNFDPNVTNFINQNMSILRTLGDLYRATSSEVLKQTRTVRSDGTEECVTQVTNPQSGGILEKLFGGLNTSNSKDDPIEVDSEEVKPRTKNERYLKTDDDE